MPSPAPASPRSQRSSAARRRWATFDPEADPAAHRRLVRAGRRCRRLDPRRTSGSGEPGTICGQRGQPPRSRCSPRGSSRPATTSCEAAAAGADAVAPDPPRSRRRDVRRGCSREAAELGLDPFVEAHDDDELARAVALGADPIGINARDLVDLRDRPGRQLELVADAPRNRTVVAESGIWSRAQGAAAELAGADAILVGSALMKAPDPAGKLATLIARPLVKVCGLTRDEDVAAAAEAGADLAGFILADSVRRAPGVLPVPETMLSVAVFVGEVEETVADLVQLYPERRRPPGPRRGAARKDGRRVATRDRSSLALGATRAHWERAADRRGSASSSPEASARRTSPRRSPRFGPGRSTRRGASRRRPGSRIASCSGHSSRRRR